MSKAQSSFPQASDIKSSNQLRNANSYEYLQYLINYLIKFIHPTQLRKSIPKKLKNILIKVFMETRKPYKEYYCYGNLYSDFMVALENYIEKNPQDNNSCINRLVEAVIINENKASERTYAIIEPCLRKYAGNNARIASAISTILPNTVSGEAGINSITPVSRETNQERFLDSFIREDVKPQLSTSQPSIRRYQYKKASDPTELRLGTEAEWHEGQARVSPVFERFIKVQAQDPLRNPKTGITHIYFNDLGRDPLPLTFFTLFQGVERSHESALTEQLQGLEKHKNIAVITLPSDKGIMSHSYIQDQTIVKDPYDRLLKIVLNHSREPVQDFYISQSIRVKLFGNQKNEEAQLKKLLSASFIALGFAVESPLTKAQFQAVWFYFTKYTLTNFIVNELMPLTFQISCKDGIDRAGVHSAFFNLIKSFEPGRTSMSLREFEQALYAAPVMVKGRGINHHRDRLWNAINSYVNANYDRLEKNPDQRWLLKWHADNYPAGLVRKAVSFSRSPRSVKPEALEYKVRMFSTDKGDPDRRSLSIPVCPNHF